MSAALAAAIAITLPLPHAALSPNGRAHHFTKARQVKIYRKLACAEALRASNCNRPMWENAVYAVAWFHPRNRFPDEDNAGGSLKAALDGLKDAGIIVDDKHLKRSGNIHFEVDAKNPRVVILVRPARSEGVSGQAG